MLPANQVGSALSLQSSFNISQTYTDNIFYEVNKTKNDFGTFLGSNLTLQYDNPDIVIGGKYSGRLALFVNNPGQNTYMQNVNINLDLPFLTKFRLTLAIKHGGGILCPRQRESIQ